MKTEIIQQFQDFMNVTQLSLEKLCFEIKSFRIETLSSTRKVQLGTKLLFNGVSAVLYFCHYCDRFFSTNLAA